LGKAYLVFVKQLKTALNDLRSGAVDSLQTIFTGDASLEERKQRVTAVLSV